MSHYRSTAKLNCKIYASSLLVFLCAHDTRLNLMFYDGTQWQSGNRQNYYTTVNIMKPAGWTMANVRTNGLIKRLHSLWFLDLLIRIFMSLWQLKLFCSLRVLLIRFLCLSVFFRWMTFGSIFALWRLFDCLRFSGGSQIHLRRKADEIIRDGVEHSLRDVCERKQFLAPLQASLREEQAKKGAKKRNANIWLVIKFNFYVCFHWKENPIYYLLSSLPNQRTRKAETFFSSISFSHSQVHYIFRLSDAQPAYPQPHHDEEEREKKGFFPTTIKRKFSHRKLKKKSIVVLPIPEMNT